MLTHYTSNVDTAISILSSGFFRMSRCTEVKTDNNEINHTLNIINNINELAEINGKLETAMRKTEFFKEKENKWTSLNKKRKKLTKKEFNSSMNPIFLENYRDAYQEALRCLITRFYYNNKIALGNVLSDILRNESYMACFTYEESSHHHLGTYGDVCFTFKTEKSPLKKIENFALKEEKVIYMEIEKFQSLGVVAKKFENSLTSLENIQMTNKVEPLYNSFFKKNYSRLTYMQKTQKIHNNFKSIYKNYNKESIVKEYEGITADLMRKLELNNETGAVILYLDKRTRDVRQNKIQDYLEDSTLIEYYAGTANPLPYALNITSCFIKPIKSIINGDEFLYENDKEYRVIALPTAENKVTQKYIEVPLDLKQIATIKLKENMKNKEINILKIKECLKNLNLSDVVVY